MDSATVARHWEANAETWTRLARAGHDVYRDALNTPAFLALLPEVRGLEGLDIGCGEGANTRAMAERGARMRGVDIAPTFVAHAEASERAEPRGIRYSLADAACLPFEDASFDFATAFMSFMDMAEQEKALAEAARVLGPGGFLQFSILHPCFMPPTRRKVRDAEGRACAVEVADYFVTNDGSVEAWHFPKLPPEVRAAAEPFQVPRFHRTLSEWVAMILSAGLSIEAMAEPKASEAVARAHPAVADTRIVPIFLHIRARKPA